MEPTSVIAGDTVTWTASYPDHPSDDGWGLTYYLAAPTHVLTPVTASADGSGGWSVMIASSETKLWPAGVYDWHARATKGLEAGTPNFGRLEVKASLEDVERHDSRTFAERSLEALEAAMVGKAAADVVSYSIGGRTVTHNSWAEAQDARDRLRKEVIQERRAARIAKGQGHSGRMLVRLP